MDSKDCSTSKTNEEADSCNSNSGSDKKQPFKRDSKGKKVKREDIKNSVQPVSDNSDDMSDANASTSKCDGKEMEHCKSNELNSSDSGNLECCASASSDVEVTATETTSDSNNPVDSDDEGEFSEMSTIETSSTTDCDDSRRTKKSKCKRKNYNISSDEEDEEEREELKRMKEESKYDPIPSTPKPTHRWSAPKSFIFRQFGESSKYAPDLFRYKCYGSLHMVQRLELMYKMKKHDGCVNTLHFNPSGTRLITGSDDLDIVMWDWTTSEPLFDYNSGHSSNVFQVSEVFIDKICIKAD